MKLRDFFYSSTANGPQVPWKQFWQLWGCRNENVLTGADYAEHAHFFPWAEPHAASILTHIHLQAPAIFNFLHKLHIVHPVHTHTHTHTFMNSGETRLLRTQRQERTNYSNYSFARTTLFVFVLYWLFDLLQTKKLLIRRISNKFRSSSFNLFCRHWATAHYTIDAFFFFFFVFGPQSCCLSIVGNAGVDRKVLSLFWKFVEELHRVVEPSAWEKKYWV